MTPPSLPLILLEETFAICRLDPGAAIPEWGTSGTFFSITRTAEEISIVCNEEVVPEGIRGENDWKCLRVAGTMPFSMVGVIAALAVPLAGAGLGIFVISTFDTDYLLIKAKDLQQAITALLQSGHSIDGT